jgi:hypothetical protein
MVVLLFSDTETKMKLRRFAENAQNLESLDFLGTINHKERRAARSAFPRFIRKKITFHGQFDCGNWVWNPEVEIINRALSKQDTEETS